MKMSREFYVPKGAVKVSDKQQLGVVYIHGDNSRFYAKAFIGKQSKPTWFYSFRTEAERERKVRGFFAGLATSQACKLERRKRDNAPHALKLGAVIVNSWGYDQTNVDWYCVVRVSAHFVTLRAIAGESVESNGRSSMAGMCAPAVDVSNPDPSTWGVRFISDKTTRHKASNSGGTNNVSMRHGSGSEWDGKPRYESWYA